MYRALYLEKSFRIIHLLGLCESMGAFTRPPWAALVPGTPLFLKQSCLNGMHSYISCKNVVKFRLTTDDSLQEFTGVTHDYTNKKHCKTGSVSDRKIEPSSHTNNLQQLNDRLQHYRCLLYYLHCLLTKREQALEINEITNCRSNTVLPLLHLFPPFHRILHYL